MRTLTNISTGALVSALVTVSALAQQAAVERKPTPNFSVAMPKFEGQQKSGPLFILASESLKSSKSETAFVSKADLELRAWSGDERKSIPLTIQAMKAVAEGCIGPLSFDEGTDWAQLSWVCPTEESNSLSRFIKFRNSAELTMTIWFAGNKIREIDASEPIPAPGFGLVAMNAYEQMKARVQ